MKIINQLAEKGLRAGIVTALGAAVAPAPEALRERLAELILRRKAEDFPPPDLKAAVRDLLRRGGFKPAGRSKPASEYLAQSAREDRFPFINNLVDINNYISLFSGLPASLLDLSAVGEKAVLRTGGEGEKYVFNEAGQEIELNGLICICRGDAAQSEPLGNLVKDSMQAKIRADTTAVVGVLFSPADFMPAETLSGLVDLFAEMLRAHGGAAAVERMLV